MLMKIRTKRKNVWKKEIRTTDRPLNREGLGHGTGRCPETGPVVPVAGAAGLETRIL